MLDAAFELAKLLPPSRLNSIASRLKTLNSGEDPIGIVSLVGSGLAKKTLQDFLDAWTRTNYSGETVALALQTASHTRKNTLEEQKVELVLTGPSTPFAITRRTEQVLLDLINSASLELFLTSFVTYRWASILEALQRAVARGVRVHVLLEASKEDGGSLEKNQAEEIESLVPLANVYHWTSKSDEFEGGKVHAKIAVADAAIAFVTSANLTGHAMEKNFEAGLLVRGGEIPGDLSSHIQGLIDHKIITKA